MGVWTNNKCEEMVYHWSSRQLLRHCSLCAGAPPLGVGGRGGAGHPEVRALAGMAAAPHLATQHGSESLDL